MIPLRVKQTVKGFWIWLWIKLYNDVYTYSPSLYGFVPSLAANWEYTGCWKERVLKLAQKLSFVVTFVPNESARPDQIANLIKELYILNRCTACRFRVCPFIGSEHNVYWLAERQSFKARTKVVIRGIYSICILIQNSNSVTGIQHKSTWDIVSQMNNDLMTIWQ